MRIIATLILVSFLFSCSQQQELQTDNQKNSIADTIPALVKPVQLLTESLEYNYKPDSKLTPWQGTLKASVYWKDNRGENIIIVSELPQYFWKDIKPEMKKYGGDEDNSEIAELFTYHYVYNQEQLKWKIYWSFNDFQFSCCDVQMTYLSGTLKITDLDNDGKAESVFTYYSTVGTQPIDLNYDAKLMFHVDSIKYSIKGLIGLYRMRVDSTAKNQYSENYSKLNPVYKIYPEKMWERTIAIRDSMDKIIVKQWGQ